MIELERQCRVSSTDSRAAADNENADAGHSQTRSPRDIVSIT